MADLLPRVNQVADGILGARIKLQRPAQHFGGFFIPLHLDEEHANIEPRLRKGGRKGDALVVARQRLIVALKLREEIAAVIERVGGVRRDRKTSVECRERFVMSSELLQNGPA